MQKNKPGINYAMGTKANVNPITGIRYGIIPQNEVLQAWCDSSELHYPETVDCEECGKESSADNENCEHCGEDLLLDCLEPLGSTYTADGYKLEQSSEGTDIWVLESPYFTYAQFCSPCAPGACYLMNPVDSVHSNNKCYCLGHDWFDDEMAPYPVYSVETGKLVNP